MMIPRGKYLGEHVGGPPKDEAEHFVRCPACGGWIDCRDLGQVCSITPSANSSRTPSSRPRASGVFFKIARPSARLRVDARCAILSDDSG